MSDPQELVQSYLSQRLTNEGLTALGNWIVADAEHARVFARHCVLHSSIRNHLLEEELKVTLRLDGDTQNVSPLDPMSDTDVAGKELILKAPSIWDEDKVSQIRIRAERQLQAFLAEEHRLHQEQQSIQLSRRHALDDYQERIRESINRFGMVLRAGAWAWILASILLLLVLVLYTNYRQRIVATLLNEADSVWLQRPESDLLRPGRLELQRGYAKIRLDNQVEVLLQAPCQLRLKSPEKVVLEQGVISVKVPPQGHGFTVKTPSAKVVDLGTEFGVRVGFGGRTRAAVFDGSLQLSGARRAAASGTNTLIVRENQQARTSAAGFIRGGVTPLSGNHGFKRSWHDVLYLPQATGQCRVLREKPTNLNLNELESSAHIFVFLERTDIYLNTDWEVAHHLPGSIDFQNEEPECKRIPAHTRMDSYLIHFDPESSPQGEKENSRCFADIHFPRPILGVITQNKQLIKTDKQFGDPAIIYPTGNRGVEVTSTNKQGQIVSISKDLQNLSLNLSAGMHIDQIRVLIAAAEPLSK